MMRLRSIVRASAIMLLLPGALMLQGAAGTRPEGRWDERLSRLDPVRPLDYLELGEEVADAAVNDADKRLARELFGFAGALDPARLGRSAMLALASIADDPTERARAAAAAELVGGKIMGGKGAVRRGLSAEPSQLEALSRAISFHRRSEGRKALNALKQDGADELLETVGDALAGGAAVFREECKSMRPGGQPLTDEDAIARGHLVELALRSGELRTPGLDLALYGDEPLIEIDLSDPQSTWRVDPKRAWWRNGAWSGNG